MSADQSSEAQKNPSTEGMEKATGRPETAQNTQEKAQQGDGIGAAMPKAPAAETKTADAAPKLVIVDDTHKYTTVFAEEYVGPGGAHHRYVIKAKKTGEVLGTLIFQDGPIKEAGVNGVMDENLLAIVIDRLNGFQKGPYASQYNETARIKAQMSLNMLNDRTKDREKRGVEGTHKV